MVQFDPDYKNAYFALYRYPPTVAGAVITCLLFLGTSLFHSYQIFRTRAWFMIAFTIGCYFEFIGYAGRAASGKQEPGYWTLTPYIVQSLFILVAPALFAASIYMCLGRVVRVTDGESHSLVRSSWMTKIFVTGDILSFLMQGSGGGMMAGGSSDPDKAKMGENLIIGGLFVQLAFLSFFVVVCGLFHYRMSLVPTARSQRPDVRWKGYLVIIYVACVLIWVRSVFRVVEYLQGHNGYLLSREIYIYIFDALLMFLVCVMLNWWHPSQILDSLKSDYSNGTLLEGGLKAPGRGRREDHMEMA